MAESPEEVLRAFRDPLAVYDELDFQAGDVDTRTGEASVLGAHVPGEVEVAFVSKAVLGAVRLEDVVVAGDLAPVAVHELSETGEVNRLVAEGGLVGHGFGDGLDIVIGAVHVVVQVVFVQELIVVSVDDDFAQSEPFLRFLGRDDLLVQHGNDCFKRNGG